VGIERGGNTATRRFLFPTDLVSLHERPDRQVAIDCQVAILVPTAVMTPPSGDFDQIVVARTTTAQDRLDMKARDCLFFIPP
jgi:hypothetical protein